MNYKVIATVLSVALSALPLGMSAGSVGGRCENDFEFVRGDCDLIDSHRDMRLGCSDRIDEHLFWLYADLLLDDEDLDEILEDEDFEEEPEELQEDEDATDDEADEISEDAATEGETKTKDKTKDKKKDKKDEEVEIPATPEVLDQVDYSCFLMPQGNESSCSSTSCGGDSYSNCYDWSNYNFDCLFGSSDCGSSSSKCWDDDDDYWYDDDDDYWYDDDDDYWYDDDDYWYDDDDDYWYDDDDDDWYGGWDDDDYWW